MKHWKAVGLETFLSAYPNIRLVDVHADKVELQGEYQLKAQLAGSRFIERTFSLKIVCPSDYPRALPVVFDTAGYFPRNQDFHTYSDGSFCLGSDLKIKSILKADSSLTTFFEKIVVRFLYSVSHRVEFGNASVLRALKALGLRKREANKLPCPCGCGDRLGSCDYRFVLNEFRQVERRRWFRDHLQEAFTPIEKPKRRVGKKTKRPSRNTP
jgi:hypothetical protein